MNEVVIPYFYYKEEDIIKVYYFSSPIRFSVYPHEYYIKFYNKLINIYIPKINLELDSYSLPQCLQIIIFCILFRLEFFIAQDIEQNFAFPLLCSLISALKDLSQFSHIFTIVFI